jgi:hypothetical protein
MAQRIESFCVIALHSDGLFGVPLGEIFWFVALHFMGYSSSLFLRAD